MKHLMKYLAMLCLLLTVACGGESPTAADAPHEVVALPTPSFWTGSVNFAGGAVVQDGWLSPGTATIVRYRVTCNVAYPFYGCDVSGDAGGKGYSLTNVDSWTIDVVRPASGAVAFSMYVRGRKFNGLTSGWTQKLKWQYVEPMANVFGPNSGVAAPDAPSVTITRILP